MKSVAERLLSRHVLGPVFEGHPCWIYSGAKDKDGYGYISVGNRTRKVHRVSYATYVGEIPAGCDVHHRCNRPACIQPTHLRGETLGDELLVVHETLPGNLDQDAPEWTLSHLPSGYAIVMLAKRDDCLATGRALLEQLTAAALRAWRSSSPPTIERRTPKAIAEWLKRCHTAGRFVAPETAGA